MPHLTPPSPNPLACSFCGKMKDEVDVLIAGPQVNICDSCVDQARGLVLDIRVKRAAKSSVAG